MVNDKRSFPVSTLPEHWWETAAAIARPYLKFYGETLNALTLALDDYQCRGIDTLEIFAPFKGGICYHGLDTIDYYQIDPSIGTLEDLLHLIAEAHNRQIAIILFINLGYGHERFPAFLKACDDIRLGIKSPETQMFLWSDTDQVKMDRSLVPYFMNDSHGSWQWSERAGKYFWVKWEGEQGGYHLPQFNFGDKGWQGEVQRIIRYWLSTGIDGMVIDAVNWYVNCNWEICRSSMTDIIREGSNQFCQPEGAGGFHDDPVQWVAFGGWNCVMDYSIKLWWEGVDIIRDALLSGDPRPVEAALRQYRDRVTAAGGICYIDPPDLSDLPLQAQVMGAALTASMGELVLLLEDLSGSIKPSGEMESFSAKLAYRKELDQLIQLRQRFPYLCAGGKRRQVSTCDDTRFYAFERGSEGDQILAVFNFQSSDQVICIPIYNLSSPFVKELDSDQWVMTPDETLSILLPPYGYNFFKIGS